MLELQEEFIVSVLGDVKFLYGLSRALSIYVFFTKGGEELEVIGAAVG